VRNSWGRNNRLTLKESVILQGIGGAEAQSLNPEQRGERIVNGIFREAESCANRLACTITQKSWRQNAGLE